MARSTVTRLSGFLFCVALSMASSSWAEEKTLDAITVGTKPGQEWSGNGLKMKFCWCPPGTFTMGSPKDEPNREEVGEDQVEVKITQGFWLAKYEVTQAEWQRVMQTTIAEQRDKEDVRNKSKKTSPPFGEGNEFPMYFVDHFEASEFCTKLMRQERTAGQLPAGWAYRLATEAQWEYACRAGTTTAMAFGSTLSSAQANFDGEVPYNGAAEGHYPMSTVRVGSYMPNSWGLCDMHRNVFEWCADWYASKAPGGVDPLVIEGNRRVFRGGCWNSQGRLCRSAIRFPLVPEERRFDVGFRVAAVQLSR